MPSIKDVADILLHQVETSSSNKRNLKLLLLLGSRTFTLNQKLRDTMVAPLTAQFHVFFPFIKPLSVILFTYLFDTRIPRKYK